MDILSMVKNIEEEIFNIRKIIHQNPELSFKEYQTAKTIEKYLKKNTHSKVFRIGDTGVLGILKGQFSSCKKVLAIRADMDALPILETTKLPFASKVEGIMHACGHDVHISVLLGAAKILSNLSNKFEGTIKFLFQPGEETLSGAKRLITQGVLLNPKVDNIIGFHCWPEIPVGTIGIRQGAMSAASDIVNLKIKGSLGHAAHPHQAVDSLLISAHILVALQALISREQSPVEPAVLSFGKIVGGTVPNIIPNEVTLSGTVRTINENSRKKMIDRIKGISEGIAKSFRGSAEIEYSFGCDSITSDPALNNMLNVAAAKVIEKNNIIYLQNPSMGSDDFAFYLKKIPGLYFRIGTRNPVEPFFPLHSSNFKVSDKSISTGISVLVSMVLEYFSNGN